MLVDLKIDIEQGIELFEKQQNLLKSGVSIMVKHYNSGSFTFTVKTHNGDATGWTEISGFMNKSYYSYNEALKGGFEWYEKHWNKEFFGNKERSHE